MKAITLLKLEDLQKWLASNSAKDKAHYNWSKYQIDQFKEDPDEFKKNNKIKLPDGSPIGTEYGCDIKAY